MNWISIEHGLPNPRSGLVLVCDAHHSGEWALASYKSNGEWRLLTKATWTPTHWMPIVLPPLPLASPKPSRGIETARIGTHRLDDGEELPDVLNS